MGKNQGFTLQPTKIKVFWEVGKNLSRWEYLTPLTMGNMPAIKKADRILWYALRKATNVHASIMKFDDPKVLKTGLDRVFMRKDNLINIL